MRITINKTKLNVLIDGCIYKVTEENGSGLYYLNNGSDEHKLTRSELKNYADVKAIDEELEKIAAYEFGYEYADEDYNYITKSEYDRLSSLKDDYEEIEWEVIEDK